MTSDFYGYLESRFTPEDLMAVIHSFFDESGKFQDHKVVAFCGFVASPSQLVDFDKQWNNQLRRTGMTALHWVDARRSGKVLGSKVGRQALAERINELKPLADCVNDYLGLGIACAFEVTGYTSFAQKSKDLVGGSDNPFYVQFLRIVGLLANYARPDESITMMCDEDETTAWNCYRLYRRVKELEPKRGRRLAAITFADDVHFPALQAADMLSFLCREQAKLQWYGEPYQYQEFFRYLTDSRGTSSVEWNVMFKNNDELKRLDNLLKAIPAKHKEKPINVKARAK
jgi:hypothetical protein